MELMAVDDDDDYCEDAKNTATIIDGKEIAEQVCVEVEKEVERIGVSPVLTVVLVGDNPASEIYVRNKAKKAHSTGIITNTYHLPENVSQEKLIEVVEHLNQDNFVNGIIVQLPLPAHLNEEAIIDAINPIKDVDGFHVYNKGKLAIDSNTGIIPCTPMGCLTLIKSTGVDLKGKKATVVGTSNIVGKPMANLLLNAGCTVTMANINTVDLVDATQEADIVIVATGVPKLITANHIKEGAIVIDVGINRLENKKIVGDVDYENVKYKAGWITPVPGGVGPMTVAYLLHNTVQAATKQLGK